MIYNAIIAAIALTVATLLFFGNFFSVTLKITTRDFLEEISTGFLKIEDTNDIDLSFLDNEIRLSTSITNRSLLIGLGGNPSKAVLYDIIVELAEQIPELATIFMTTIIAIAIIEALDEILGEDDMPPDILAVLDMNEISDILRQVLSGEINEETFLEKVDEIMYQAMLDLEIDSEDRERIIEEYRDSIGEFFYQFSNEYSYIDEEYFAFLFLAYLLELEYDGNLTREILVAALIESLQAEADSSIITILNIIFIAMAILLLITILVWVLLFIFAVIRIFTKNKRVGTKLAQSFGWVAFTVLVIIPAVTILILGIANVLPAGLSLSFMSMTLVSFIGAVLLLVINIVGYSRAKKQSRNTVI